MVALGIGFVLHGCAPKAQDTSEATISDFGDPLPSLTAEEAERFVADALVGQGWTLIARNWRGSGGEIDVIVTRGGAVRFVEVKARSPGDELAWEAVSHSKQRKLARAAQGWLMEQEPAPLEACFLVAIVWTEDPWRIEWIDNAFDA